MFLLHTLILKLFSFQKHYVSVTCLLYWIFFFISFFCILTYTALSEKLFSIHVSSPYKPPEKVLFNNTMCIVDYIITYVQLRQVSSIIDTCHQFFSFPAFPYFPLKVYYRAQYLFIISYLFFHSVCSVCENVSKQVIINCKCHKRLSH